MIEPVSDALTTSIRPACSAKNAMISSAMLPNVALRMPPTCGPVSARAARSTARRPRRDRGSPPPRATNRTVGSAWSPKSRMIAATLSGDRPDQDDRDRASTAGRGWAGRPGLMAALSHADASRPDRRAVQPASRDPGRGRHPSRGLAPGPPAATSRSTSATCGLQRRRLVGGARASGRPPDQAPTTSTNSPRAGIAPSRSRARARQASRARSPRGSWSARGRRPPGRSAPHAAARSRSVRRDPPGRLVDDRAAVVGGDPARAVRDARARDRGRNPSNVQRGPATPDAATAASTADAPGIGTTGPPSAAQAATSSPPGIADGRRPASVTSARSAPPRRCVEQRRRPARAAPGVVARRPRRRSRGGRAAGACQPRVLGRDRAAPPAGPRAPAA